MDYNLLVSMLKEEEAVREKPYKDSEGILTIGVGRNLEDKGLRPKEIDYLLANDIEEVNSELKQNPLYTSLDNIRQTVLADMCFNIGYPRLLGFKNMWKAIEQKDFIKAADEMLDSKWAKQVGKRAIRLSRMMRFGIYYEL